MAQIIEVTDINVPELAAFTRLTEAQLRNRLEPERGLCPVCFRRPWRPGGWWVRWCGC